MAQQLTKQARKHQQLLNALLENVTTVKVVFKEGPSGQSAYTYKVPKHWGVKPMDCLVVDSPRTGLTVVQVVSVDAVPDFDQDADFQYKWAVQLVDRSGYDAQRKREALFLEQLAVVEREHVRQETLAKAQAALTGTAAEAFQRAVATLTGTPFDSTVVGAKDAATAS